MRKLNKTLICVTVMSLFAILPVQANAQAPRTPTSVLSPPINHEVAKVDEVITVTDDGYRFRGYVLTWRSMRIVIAGAPDQSYGPGDNIDVLVYRTEANGRKVLRFDSSPSASNEDVVDSNTTGSGASMTLGTARIEETVSAESEGWRFVGYFVTWHDKRVFVVDTQAASTHPIGETINFRVFRTGLGTAQRLSFSL